DLEQGKSLGLSGEVFDFRMEQIRRRLEKREDVFKNLFPLYPEFKSYLESGPQRVILGNAWPSDLFLLKNFPENFLLVVVPHQLGHEILGQFREGLKEMGRDVVEINDFTREFKKSKTLLINK